MTVRGATRLTEAQCERAMAGGEFGADVVGSAESVVVALTQGWCPQWKAMARWLGEAAAEAGALAYYVEYDEEPFFERFMAWKEDELGNRSVPYLRYYRGGALVAESNYVSRDGVLARLRRG
ncbi:MAG TPA: hypothetical protein P5298_10665 [Spirochaetia bacterium]|nr:hypothetical protein [Spirochaetaceae bacterium]HPE89326.1 hypothetical protein [Spirochaetales bacterium]HRW24863.1 hypothetical protein [Spirochaetia bacterium]